MSQEVVPDTRLGSPCPVDIEWTHGFDQIWRLWTLSVMHTHVVTHTWYHTYEKGNAPEASFPEVDLRGPLAHARAEISLCAPVQLHSSTETAPDLP